MYCLVPRHTTLCTRDSSRCHDRRTTKRRGIMNIKDPIFWINKMDAYADPAKHALERASNGFSTYDWWNFDEYIAWVNVQALTKFRDESNGRPAGLTEDEWREILNLMIDGFV